MALVSVVITVFNGEQFIESAIVSILNQTLTDFELLIINDGSTDKSQEIIDKLASTDNRIKTFINAENKGQALSRNMVLSEIQGKYIATMDADDYSLPDRLHVQYDFMEQNKDIVLCGSFIDLCDENLNTTGIKKYPIFDDEIRKKIFRISPFAHPSTFYRTDIARSIGGYSYVFKAALDYDFYFKIGNFGKLQNIDTVLLKYRVHSQSISQSKGRLQQELTLYIRLKAIFEYSYNWTFGDKIYWILQYLGIKVFPTSWIFTIYHLLRKFK